MLPKRLAWGTRKTSLGWIGVLAGPEGVARVVLPHRSERSVKAELCQSDGSEAVEDAKAVSRLLNQLADSIEGKSVDFSSWKLDWSRATPFQRRVWNATRRIPRGQTRSYWWVAVRAGSPRAARAVGQAMGAHPMPLVVPCHRVLRTGGGIGGFGGGLELKRELLKVEGCEIATA
jgi:O-6-methylguanine DNA methyltransferase